jgi:hypothetical protein
MLNKTTNQATSIGITPPNNVTSIGATAEWIVEGISSILPVFSTVVFTNGSAGTKNHAFNMKAESLQRSRDRVGQTSLRQASYRIRAAWSNGSSPVSRLV